jgi:hypothetical protein
VQRTFAPQRRRVELSVCANSKVFGCPHLASPEAESQGLCVSCYDSLQLHRVMAELNATAAAAKQSTTPVGDSEDGPPPATNDEIDLPTEVPPLPSDPFPYEDAMVKLVATIKPPTQHCSERASSPVPKAARRSSSIASIDSREDDIMRGKERLIDRLTELGLCEFDALDDGNCQFAAISHQLFRDQRYHKAIRAKVMQYISQHKSQYIYCFDGEQDLDRYIEDMSRDYEWGDEISLRAASDCFQLFVHVILSTEGKWYLRYRPLNSRNYNGTTTTTTNNDHSNSRHVFLSYLSPIHYNSVIHVNEKRGERENKPPPGGNYSTTTYFKNQK